jgi:hypothetical protein
VCSGTADGVINMALVERLDEALIRKQFERA